MNKTFLLLIVFFSLPNCAFGQMYYKHGMSVGLLNQTSLLSAKYDYISSEYLYYSAGIGLGPGTPLLTEIHLKKDFFDIGIGLSTWSNKKPKLFALVGVSFTENRIIFRIGLDFVLNESESDVSNVFRIVFVNSLTISFPL